MPRRRESATGLVATANCRSPLRSVGQFSPGVRKKPSPSSLLKGQKTLDSFFKRCPSTTKTQEDEEVAKASKGEKCSASNGQTPAIHWRAGGRRRSLNVGVTGSKNHAGKKEESEEESRKKWLPRAASIPLPWIRRESSLMTDDVMGEEESEDESIEVRNKRLQRADSPPASCSSRNSSSRENTFNVRCGRRKSENISVEQESKRRKPMGEANSPHEEGKANKGIKDEKKWNAPSERGSEPPPVTSSNGTDRAVQRWNSHSNSSTKEEELGGESIAERRKRLQRAASLAPSTGNQRTREKSSSREKSVNRRNSEGTNKEQRMKRGKRKEYEYNTWHQRPVLDKDLLGEEFCDGSPIFKTNQGGVPEYVIDFIMLKDKNACLIKWCGYDNPTVEPWTFIGKGSAKEFFEEGEKAAALILPCLKRECLKRGTDFATEYPHAEMRMPKVEMGSYVKGDQRVEYLVKLGQWEAWLNRESRGRGLPAIRVFDWTADGHTHELPKFEFTADVYPVTEEARNLLEKTVTMEIANGIEGCGCSGKQDCSNKTGCGCHRQRLRYKKMDSCLELGKTEKEKFPVDIWECGDDCSCAMDCVHRVVQRGRKVILALVRDPRKGWTLRTCQKLLHGQFISVYGGEVKVLSGDDDITYQMDIDSNALESGRDLVLDAKEVGCEARFMSHSCSANTFGLQVHFKRKGFSPLHVAIFANREITAGQELTCNYHYHDGIEIPYDCWCGHRCCRRPAQELVKTWKEEDKKKKSTSPDEKENYGGRAGKIRKSRHGQVSVVADEEDDV